MPQTDFKGKVVLVTGSSSGIGAEIAIHFCKLGASVVITGRNQERLQMVVQRCQHELSGALVFPIVADLKQETDIVRIIEETVAKFGQLDVLINNAGIYQLGSILDKDYMNLYDGIFETNVRSVVQLTWKAVPHLLKTKGNIVNVSSVASHKPGSTNTIYAMSKCAIDMFTKCMALELGPKGIRVNAINPAAIRTPIFDKVQNSDLGTDQMVEMAAKSYPLGRIGEPEDCARAVAYLASDDASFVSGVTLLVDGASVNSPLILPKQAN